MITGQTNLAYAVATRANLGPMSAADQAVVRALDRTWAAIRERDERVPAQVTFDLTPGTRSSCASVGWGQPTPVLEINLRPLGQNGRNLTSTEALEFLLHQAAHAAAGSTPTSEGRWHSVAYQSAAKGLGLAAKVATGGYASTELATGARTSYRNELGALDRALKAWTPETVVKTERSARNGVVLKCLCGDEGGPAPSNPPRRIRIRGVDPDTGQILCERCGSEFHEVIPA